MDSESMSSPPDIHFMRITATTLNQICALSETLSPAQRRMVVDNVRSIAEAHFSPVAWMRAIYADETPIGFIMTHTGSDYEDGIDCPGVFLWRFLLSCGSIKTTTTVPPHRTAP